VVISNRHLALFSEVIELLSQGVVVISVEDVALRNVLFHVSIDLNEEHKENE